MTVPVSTRRATARNNRTFVAGFIAGALLAALIAGFFVAASDAADPWHGVPWCTDAIADAGGICHGDPARNPDAPDMD